MSPRKLVAKDLSIVSSLRFYSVVLISLMVAALSACRQPKVQTASAPPLVPVSIARSMQEPVPVDVQVVGTVEPSAVVQVKSQVGGQLMRVGFTEGQDITKGTVLFEIDARPFQEALRQAEAGVSRDRAQLRQAEATLARDQAQVKYADADAARNTELVKEGIVSRAQQEQVRTSADLARESARASQAAIESARAALESDLAAVDRAKLDISYCTIHAPISGRAGNLLVHPGNLVRANDVPLVILHQLSPVFVSFSVPEQHLPAVRRLNARGPVPVRATPQGETSVTATGRLSVIDNTVDATTGTIRLKAVFENRERALWPGQFTNVILSLGTQEKAIVVPAESLQVGQQGSYVYVVKPDNSVEVRVVSAGRTSERKVVIEKGLAPGETVVTDGQMRLFPGARIKPVDARKIDSEKL